MMEDAICLSESNSLGCVSGSKCTKVVDKEEKEILFITKAVKLTEDFVVFDDAFYLEKRNYWRERIGEIKNVVAPMVDQSELAFRMMLRHNGAHLCYTPMIHAHLFVNDYTYRRSAFSTVAADRPLIVQFCANDPLILLKACRLVEGFCDGVDLNLGCPQLIAKRGRYGAYLQEYKQLIASMISTVYKHCRLPISAKIRLLDDINQTIEYARLIENAGASMLAVHGRVREQRGVNTGLANWSAIAAVKKAISIPVIANGNIQLVGDVERCIKATGVDAVMSAEGILSNPLLFVGRNTSASEVAREYIRYAIRYKANISAMRAHIFRICHYSLLKNRDLRERNSYVCTASHFLEIVDELERRSVAETASSGSPKDCWKEACESGEKLLIAPSTMEVIVDNYMKNLIENTPYFMCKPYIRPSPSPAANGESAPIENLDGTTAVNADQEVTISTYRQERHKELERLIAESGLSKRQIRKRERRRVETQKRVFQLDAALNEAETDASSNGLSKKIRFSKCERCQQPAGVNCANSSCKRCCRLTCIRKALDCKIHRFDHVAMEAKRFRYAEQMGITLDELYKRETENNERIKFLKNAKKVPLDMEKIEGATCYQAA